MDTTISLFPCKSLEKTLDFYQALGFEVDFQQKDPYVYAVIHRGDLILHFSALSTWKTRNSVSLVFANNIEDYHSGFVEGLRKRYGQVPTADFPRITRRWAEQTRFHLFDPDGNTLIFIDSEEESEGYEFSEGNLSPLLQSLENAIFLRDVYCNDKAAASVLDRAISKNKSSTPIDRARVLATRAELELAMGNVETAQAIRQELKQIPLSETERLHYQDELDAVVKLEQWQIN